MGVRVLRPGRLKTLETKNAPVNDTETGSLQGAARLPLLL
jgi:hypothetical protein